MTQVARAGDSPASLREAFPVFARHASPRMLMTGFVVALAIRLSLGGLALADAVAAALIIGLWPIQEWLLHVYFLHLKPVTLVGRRFDLRVPRKHRAHHRDPWRYELLFIPLHSYLYSIPSLLAVTFLLAPSASVAMTGVVVYLALGLHYECVHFLVHTRVTPRGSYYQRLWRNHRLHHFKNENYWYGVTRLEGDWLLGTAPRSEQVPLSPTARTLGEGEQTRALA